MADTTCCFLGHRKINVTNKLNEKLYNIIEALIVEKNIDTFLFGSKSQFNDLCYHITSQLKAFYPNIKRVYVRAEFPHINDSYKTYLLESYEETHYPDSILNAGKSAYIKRNFEMINNSSFCIVYFDKSYTPPTSRLNHKYKSGTGIAYDYAVKKQKHIINVFNDISE